MEPTAFHAMGTNYGGLMVAFVLLKPGVAGQYSNPTEPRQRVGSFYQQQHRRPCVYPAALRTFRYIYSTRIQLSRFD